MGRQMRALDFFFIFFFEKSLVSMSQKHNKMQFSTYNLHLLLVLREEYGFASAILRF